VYEVFFLTSDLIQIYFIVYWSTVVNKNYHYFVYVTQTENIFVEGSKEVNQIPNGL